MVLETRSMYISVDVCHVISQYQSLTGDQRALVKIHLSLSLSLSLSLYLSLSLFISLNVSLSLFFISLSLQACKTVRWSSRLSWATVCRCLEDVPSRSTMMWVPCTMLIGLLCLYQRSYFVFTTNILRVISSIIVCSLPFTLSHSGKTFCVFSSLIFYVILETYWICLLAYYETFSKVAGVGSLWVLKILINYLLSFDFPTIDWISITLQVMIKCWDKMPERRPTFDHLYHYFDDFFVSSQPNYVPPSV